MRLVIDKFKSGIVDENVLTMTGIPQDALVDMQDVELYPRGVLAKRPGYTKMHGTAWNSNAITRIYVWKDTSGTNRTMTFSCSATGASGSIAEATISDTTVTFSSKPCTGTTWEPTLSDPISCTTYAGSGVFVYGGAIPPICYNGTSNFTETISAAPSGARHVESWGNYLFVANILSGATRLGSRIQWCYPGNPASWPVSYYADLDPDDGGVITAVVRLGESIVVFKDEKTFVGRWVGGTQMFQFDCKSTTIGCVGTNAVIERRGMLYFQSKDGFYRFDGYSPPVDLTGKIKNQMYNINLAYSSIGQAEVYESKHQVWFTVPWLSSTVCNKIFIYDYELEAWTKFNITCSAISRIPAASAPTFASLGNAYYTYETILEEAGGSQSLNLVFGTSTSYLMKYGTSNNDDGTAIDGYFTMPWFDFGYSELNKRLIRVTILVDEEGDYNLDCYVYIDWNESSADSTHTISLTGESLVLERRLDFTRHFRALQLKFGTDDTSSPFVVHRIIIDYLLKGRTLVT